MPNVRPTSPAVAALVLAPDSVLLPNIVFPPEPLDMVNPVTINPYSVMKTWSAWESAMLKPFVSMNAPALTTSARKPAKLACPWLSKMARLPDVSPVYHVPPTVMAEFVVLMAVAEAVVIVAVVWFVTITVNALIPGPPSLAIFVIPTVVIVRPVWIASWSVKASLDTVPINATVAMAAAVISAHVSGLTALIVGAVLSVSRRPTVPTTATAGSAMSTIVVYPQLIVPRSTAAA
jgi:hypothetical protein